MAISIGQGPCHADLLTPLNASSTIFSTTAPELTCLVYFRCPQTLHWALANWESADPRRVQPSLT